MASKKAKPNELYIERIYDAPVKMVWDAWVDPKQVAKWWGPRGFTLTTRNKEVKPGGKWNYVMHGPDGKDWENRTYFHEVEQYSKLVYDHGATDDTPPMFRVTVLFSEVKGHKTKMEMIMALATEEAAKETAKFVKQAGGNSTWDRLAEFLIEEKDKKEVFVINRSFEAPLNTVFEMFANPDHLAKWMGPASVDMKFIRAEIKPGGSSFYHMVGPGMELYGKIKYHEITKPSRMVYSQYFCDEGENTIRHPMAPTWPEGMLTTIQFEAEDEANTRVTITWEMEGKVTPAEREAFLKERGGMTQGWTGSFDKLEAYLAKK